MTALIFSGDAIYVGAHKIGERPAAMPYTTWDCVVELLKNAERDVDAEITEAIEAADKRADEAEARADRLAEHYEGARATLALQDQLEERDAALRRQAETIAALRATIADLKKPKRRARQ